MKRFFAVIFLTVVLLFAVGCAKEEEAAPPSIPEAQPLHPPPPPEEVKEPEALVPEEPEQEEEEEYDPLGDWRIPENAITDPVCDAAAESLSFTFTNTGTKLWELGTILPFPPPQDRISVKLIINGREVSEREGEFFGPGGFPEHCKDTIALEPGESVACSIEHIPIIKDTGFTRNTMLVQGNNVNFQERFYCE